MRHARARLAALVAMIVLALALPTAALADSHVDVRVTEDGVRRIDSAFELVELEDEPVDEYNIANAYASCDHCQAYAISFQIVLAEDATSIEPLNYAQAVNEECTGCEVGAWAKQWVRVGTEEPELTDRGEQILKSVKKQVKELRKRSDLDRAGIDAEVARLTAVVDDVLATELRWGD